MAKVTVPVAFVTYPAEWEFPLGLWELFDELKVFDPVEDFTFTGRVDLGLKGRTGSQKAEVLRLRREFRRRLKEAVADPAARRRLLGWFRKNDWSVSFFVDHY